MIIYNSFEEIYKNPVDRLRQLLAENPDLPLYPIVEISQEWENTAVEYLTRYSHFGKLYDVYIDEIVEPEKGKVYYKSDKDYKVLRYYCSPSYEDDFDTLYDEVPPWEKVIVLCIIVH